MATPEQTQAVSPIYDHPNNPFMQNERMWNTDEEASIEVHHYLRRAIARLQFYLQHPLMGETIEEEHVIHLKNEIRRFEDLLNKAHYN